MTLIASRYERGTLLGSIKHSEFYEGVDTRDNSTVIVRLIHLDPHQDKLFLQAFMHNELRLMKMLNHPNILRVLDYGIEGQTYYQINEHVSFKTLRSIVRPGSPLPYRRTLQFGLELADIVAHLHRLGLIHCDLRPDNILLSQNQLKLMGFSIANHVIVEGTALGTPPYMSPESIRGAAPTPLRDIWALGIVLYEMLQGVPPYRLDDSGEEPSDESVPKLFSMILRDSVPSFSTVAPDVSPKFIGLIHRMLAKDPTERISSMRQVAAELEALLDNREPLSVNGATIIAGRFSVEAIIGEGGFSQLYRARDHESGSTVAIKQLKTHLSLNKTHVKRFQREAMLLKRLHHPHIVGLIDSFAVDDQYYIVMPFVEGGDLRQQLLSGPMPLSQALTLGGQVAHAVHAAHQAGIVHRDIKPENILLDLRGSPLVTDFGVARGDALTALTADGMVGTLLYTAPEILDGESPSSASDVWAFAVMMYEMLSGKTPFERDTVMHTVVAILNDPVPSLTAECSGCPSALVALIDGLLTRDPERRRGRMNEIGDEIQRILSETSSLADVAAQPPRRA